MNVTRVIVRNVCLLLPLVVYICLPTDNQAAPAVGNAKQAVKSPDGSLVLTFNLVEGGAPVYNVTYKGGPIVIESRLGLELKDAAGFVKGLKVTGVQPGSHDETWKPVAAERSSIRDHYNSLTVSLEGEQGRKLQLAIRAYNEGVGFRYTLPEQEGLKEFTITNEVTEFGFDGDHPCWPVYSAQGEYKAGLKLSDVKKNCERPLTVEIPGGPCFAVGEAGMVDYFRMCLQPSDRPNAVKVFPDGVVTGKTPFSSPWRFIMVGDTPGELLEHNFLVLNLNEPCAIKDASWIKPGKVIREMTLSTVGAKACIDFAARMGLQYIMFDGGWYSPQARQPHQRQGRSALDMQEVVRYGDSKGIGVILYVDRRELEKRGEELYRLYHQWGVKGVKYGFVNVGPQQWSRWVADNVRLCAENKLMVDIHDEYRSTGLSRTWPNLMTMEGVNGNEGFPPASDTLTQPFTRGLCGSFDYTTCMFDKRLTNTNPVMPQHLKDSPPRDFRKSRAFQLAQAVIVFSPWQFLYWYDTPAMAHDEPELEFWKTLPTAWDETKVINGVIGQYVTEARRSGAEWFVGSLNANQQRTLKIPLSFLEPGTKYTAVIYSEGVPGSREANDLIKVNIETNTVDATTVIKAVMSDIGGHSMRLTPVD